MTLAIIPRFEREMREILPILLCERNGSDVMPCEEVEANLAKFQNPVEADKITRMQRELDEVSSL